MVITGNCHLLKHWWCTFGSLDLVRFTHAMFFVLNLYFGVLSTLNFERETAQARYDNVYIQCNIQ